MTTATKETEKSAGAAPKALRLLADWGMAETDALTLGELIEEIRLSKGGQPAWEDIARIPLCELATPTMSVLEVLEEWAKALTEREQAIFWGRMAPTAGKKTLEELGGEHRIAYATTWETQEGVRIKLLDLMVTEQGLPISRKVQTIRRTIGSALREETVNDILDLDPESNVCRDLLLELAGPYRKDGEWLVLERMADTDPTEELVRSADERGWLNERLVSYRLETWGLEPEKHRDWITRDGRIKEFRGRLVRWGSKLADRAVFALEDLGTPATAREILEHLAENVTQASLHVSLSKDPRLVRTGPKLWGLRSWNLPRYEGTASEMKKVLMERGQVPVRELLEIMTRKFGAVEVSFRSAANRAEFVTSNGVIRIRDASTQTPGEGRSRTDRDV